MRIIDGEGADAKVENGENIFAFELPRKRLQEDAAVLRGGQRIGHERLRKVVTPAAERQFGVESVQMELDFRDAFKGFSLNGMELVHDLLRRAAEPVFRADFGHEAFDFAEQGAVVAGERNLSANFVFVDHVRQHRYRHAFVVDDHIAGRIFLQLDEKFLHGDDMLVRILLPTDINRLQFRPADFRDGFVLVLFRQVAGDAVEVGVVEGDHHVVRREIDVRFRAAAVQPAVFE